MLDRLRGTYSGPPSMTSVVATLVVLGILVRIAAMFTNLDVSSNGPMMLCGCGFWTGSVGDVFGVVGVVLTLVLSFVAFVLAPQVMPRP